MSPEDAVYVQKIFLKYINYPETDDSDSDFEPDDYESSASEDDEFEDSEEDDEDDLDHLDPANVITGGLLPHERVFKVSNKTAIAPTGN